ncbi:MAG: PAS domain-containing protein, partial [Clostridia bacterium]|nr:PAS domain-containing protein [Clostridia bacterium]
MEKEKQMSHLKEMVSNVNKIAFWEMDAVNNELKPDDHWKILMGIPENNTKPFLQFWIDKVHPEDTYVVDSFIRFCNTPSNNEEFDCSYRLFNEIKQRYIWVHCVGIITERNENGYPMYIIGLEQDITKQKDVEKTLEESKKWLERAQKTSKISYFRYDFNTQKYIYPKELAELLGFNDPVDLDVLMSSMIEEYKEEFNRRLNNLINNYEDFEYDFGIEINSEIKYIHAYVHIVRDKEGVSKEVFGIMQDITERVETQSVNEMLSKMNQRLQKVNNLAITAGNLLIWNFDYELFPDGDEFYVSENYAGMLGLEMDEKGFIKTCDD